MYSGTAGFLCKFKVNPNSFVFNIAGTPFGFHKFTPQSFTVTHDFSPLYKQEFSFKLCLYQSYIIFFFFQPCFQVLHINQYVITSQFNMLFSVVSTTFNKYLVRNNNDFHGYKFSNRLSILFTEFFFAW